MTKKWDSTLRCVFVLLLLLLAIQQRVIEIDANRKEKIHFSLSMHTSRFHTLTHTRPCVSPI